MKRKLYFCERCQRVYAANVNNGVCREPSAGRGRVAEWCDGTIRPIDYQPPTKDPAQRDIEDIEDADAARWETDEKTWRALHQGTFPPRKPNDT